MPQNEKNENATYERFFNVRITIPGDSDIPFNPLPWLRLHIEMIEWHKGKPFIYFPKRRNSDGTTIDGAVVNTASFSLAHGLPLPQET